MNTKGIALLCSMLFVVSLFSFSCTKKYVFSDEDRSLLENSLGAAKSAESASEKATRAVNSAQNAADRAEAARDRAESAADRAEKAAEKSERIYQQHLMK